MRSFQIGVMNSWMLDFFLIHLNIPLYTTGLLQSILGNIIDECLGTNFMGWMTIARVSLYLLLTGENSH